MRDQTGRMGERTFVFSADRRMVGFLLAKDLTVCRSRQHFRRESRSTVVCGVSQGMRKLAAGGLSVLAFTNFSRIDAPSPVQRLDGTRTELVSVVETKSPGKGDHEKQFWKPLSARDLVRWTVGAKILSAGALTALGLTILALYIVQDRLVYWPSKLNKGNPARFGMTYEDVKFCTVDGIEITGWFIKNEALISEVPTVIYFHGTDKNASFRLRKAAELYKAMECNILLVSYRGYGDSGGRPTEKGLIRDADAKMQYIRSRTDIDPKNLWVYGESLGGAVALWFTEKYESDLRGLMLENTFTSLLDMIKVVHPWLDPLKILSKNKWLSLERIQLLKIPVLFLSGDSDEFVPPEMMRKLHKAAQQSSYKQFVSFAGGSHNNTWRLEGFFDAMTKFVKRCSDLERNSESPTEHIANII